MQSWITVDASIKWSEADLKAHGLEDREDITSVERYTAMMEEEGWKLSTCQIAFFSSPFSPEVSYYKLHFTQPIA